MKMFVPNKNEKKIFNLLLEAQQIKAPNVTIRVAGGWVRDSVLGLESHDIDICVDKMSGHEFALKVREFMIEKGLPVKEVAQVSANVEANKNLESAILTIFGQEVDFVQLRAESYTEDSRNPEIKVGVSAQEDAFRRDLTINSLFYNIHTKEVEDYCGGLKDLENRIARTPIDPERVFKEDPLRIFRAIRFAARFELQVEDGLIQASKLDVVRSSLHRKISKERIWSEFFKIMSGPNVPYALELFEQFGLREMFFVPSEEAQDRISRESGLWSKGFAGWDMDQNNPHHTFNVWDHTLAAIRWLSENGPEEDVALRFVALLLHDVGKCDFCSQQVGAEKTTYHGHEISSAEAADEILKAMKSPKSFRERVVKLIRNHMRLHCLGLESHSGLRRVMRNMGSDFVHLVWMSKADSMGKAEVQLDEKYDIFLSRWAEQDQEFKSPLSGVEIMEILKIKPGPLVGQAKKLLEEELLNGELTKEEAISFLLKEFNSRI